MGFAEYLRKEGTMHWQYTPYILPLMMTAAISAGTAFVIWRRRQVPGALPLLLMMLAVLEWSLGNVLELASTDLSSKLFWANIEYLGIVILPVMWLALAFEYNGREKWLTYRNFALLAIMPFVTLLLVWTNKFHGLVRYNIKLDTSGPFPVVTKTYGIWFWVHTTYSYALFFLGTFVFIQALIKPPCLYRKQAIALLIGALIPFTGNILYISGLSPIPRFDITPCAFGLSGLIIAWALFRLGLLDVMPMAREAIIEGMSAGVIVLDVENRIVDLNPAAQHIIGLTALQSIGQPITRILSAQPDFIKQYHHIKEAQTEIILGKGKARRYYDLHISPLYDRRGRLISRLFVLHEITEQKRAEASLQKSKQKIESLHEIARDLEICKTEEEVYQLIVYAAEKILDLSMYWLAIVEGNKLVVKATSFKLGREASRDRNINEGLAGKTYRTGKTYVFSNQDESPDIRLIQKYFKSGISAPIGDIGVVQVFSPKPDAFTEDDTRLLELLLGYVAESSKRIRLQNKLREQAIHDYLTGLYNRRYFTQIIEKEFERSKRYKHLIGFLMADVNRFKEINDRFGHQVGDRMLQEVGKLLQEQVREVDIVVRYGGDEFLIILPETKGDTEAMVQRIREAIAKWNKENTIVDFPVTLAIGTSYWHPAGTESVEACLHKADQRMYEDKKINH